MQEYEVSAIDYTKLKEKAHDRKTWRQWERTCLWAVNTNNFTLPRRGLGLVGLPGGLTNYCPSVLWHCWLGLLTHKNSPWYDLYSVWWNVKPYSTQTLWVPSNLFKTRTMAIAIWTCVSWVAYSPGTIAVNVTWIEREFNACQTPRSMYPFNHFWDIAVYRWRVTGFQQYSWANERFLTTFCFPLGTPLGQSW